MPTPGRPLNNTIQLHTPENPEIRVRLSKMYEVLYAENYAEYINHLYYLGLSLQTAWQSKGENEEKNFLNYLQKKIVDNAFNEKPTVEELSKSARNLEVILTAWEDPGLPKTEKLKRQRHKIKRVIDIANRRLIHIALFAQVVALVNNLEEIDTNSPLFKKIQEINASFKKEIGQNKKLKNEPVKNVLVKTLKDIKLLNKVDKVDEKQTLGCKAKNSDKTGDLTGLKNKNKNNNSNGSSEKIAQESQELLLGDEAALRFKKVKEALISFKTPLDKFLYQLSLFISLLAGVSCGTVAAWSIYWLLVGTVGVPFGLATAVIMFMAGFSANFNYFSYDVPKLLLTFFKTGGITAFIDQNGNRVQISNQKKLLLIPAALVSVAVGVCVSAFFIGSSKNIVAFIPFLAATWPAITILAFAIFLAMSFVMFSAFVEVLRKPFNLAELWQDFVKVFSEITFGKALGYIVKGLIFVFVIFSLYFLCFTGIPTLANILGDNVAHIFGFASFIGQIPFCIRSVNRLCNFVAKLRSDIFFSTNSNSTGRESLPEPVWSNLGFNSPSFIKLKSLLVNGSLVVNAVGNGALVVVRTLPITYVAGAGNILISMASNMVPAFDEGQERLEADDRIVEHINDAMISDSPMPSTSTANFSVDSIKKIYSSSYSAGLYSKSNGNSNSKFTTNELPSNSPRSLSFAFSK